MIPDGIEPVVCKRSWGFDGQQLVSQMGGARWPVGEPMEAACGYARWVWVAVESGGMSLEDIAATVHPGLGTYAVTASSASVVVAPPTAFGPEALPNVTLPEGWGYVPQVERHDAPNEHCSCGVYGAVPGQHHPDNEVWGEVYLWGKVIRGQTAHRAQFAYPKKLVTNRESLVEALKAYGVEVELYKPKPKRSSDSSYLVPFPYITTAGGAPRGTAGGTPGGNPFLPGTYRTSPPTSVPWNSPYSSVTADPNTWWSRSWGME